MAFWDIETLKLEAFRPGIMSRAESGKNLIMVCMEIGAAQEDTGHTHTFDQCGIILAGKIEMFVGQERQLLKANDCYFIPTGVRHGWKTYDNSVKLLDITPRQL